MGRSGKKWSRKRKVEERAAKSNKERKEYHGGAKDGYNVVKMSNAKFEAYYSYVGLHNSRYDAGNGRFVPCASDAEKHAERDLFMSTLSEVLPASFRVDRSLDQTIQRTILDELQQFIGKKMELEIELPRTSVPTGGRKEILERVGASDSRDLKLNGSTGAKSAEDYDDDDEKEGNVGDEGKTDNGPIIVRRTIAPAKPIPFISSNDTILGYQLSVDKRTLRRNKSLETFHTWLKIQTDCGHITRQETVSMIPPVVLNVKEGMSVLDMCAAPGSKTCQLLEVVGGLPNTIPRDRESKSLEPSGYVVANDADPKRAYMLVTQLRRMNSPSVFVTSCDGQFFPILDDKSVRGTEREGMFDRVLCDVPCSGDGTVRKNPGIWKHWNQLGSLALHPLQLSIALRSVRLTKVGGYIVYSTCSMNPMENESVVAELLRIADGSLVLEDPRHRMEGLIARPGWSTWKVLRENKNRTRKGMKEWKKKNNPKMQERRKEAEEKRIHRDCPPPIEPEANENQKDGEEEERNLIRSKYDTIPYIPPATWDNDALSERTKSLGFVEYASFNEVEPDWNKRVRASCFPPTEEEARRFELHKCLRSLPQVKILGDHFFVWIHSARPKM
jgi:16S rRNA C967 or C1407 C5-methylase (RsmB/RsmF family)